MTRAEKAAEKKLDAKIEELYRKRCSGIQINIMDIGSVFRVGKAAVRAGKSEDAIGDEIFAFVQTIRKTKERFRCRLSCVPIITSAC